MLPQCVKTKQRIALRVGSKWSKGESLATDSRVKKPSFKAKNKHIHNLVQKAFLISVADFPLCDRYTEGLCLKNYYYHLLRFF